MVKRLAADALRRGSRCRGWLGDACAARRCSTTSQIAALVFAGAAPDSTVLVGGDGEIETLLLHTAVRANRASAHQHAQCLAGVADGEEHVWIDLSAVGVHSPGVVSGTKGEALSEDGHAGVRLSAERPERKGQIGYPFAARHMRTATQIMAHRGASRAAPANTVEAFALARRLGSHAVELDVRQCATGELVVHHDPTLADGRIIAHVPKARLPETIPTLDEALDACGDMWVNVEVKNHRTEPDYDGNDDRTMAVLRVLRRRVDEHGDPSRYLLSCFRRRTVDRAVAEWPELPTAWLTLGVDDAEALANDLSSHGHAAVHPEVSRVTRELIDAFHAKSLRVNTWTCDDPVRMRELIAWGIDGICTNVPDVALAVLRETS